MSATLNELCKEGWLQVAVPGVGPVAHQYEPGPRLNDRQQRRLWFELTDRLHGQDGFASDVLASPAAARGYLGEAAMLVLGALAAAERTPSMPELTGFMKAVMDPKTTRSAVARLRANLLLPVDGLDLAANWRSDLEGFVRHSGADRHADRVVLRVADERLAYQKQAALNGGPPRRGVGCFFGCGRDATGWDHFPPAHWYGIDHASFLWPSCTKCNSRWGAFIRHLGEVFPQPGTWVVRSEADYRRAVHATYEICHAKYVRAVDLQQAERVRTMVERFMPAWLAAMEVEPPSRQTVVIDPMLTRRPEVRTVRGRRGAAERHYL